MRATIELIASAGHSTGQQFIKAKPANRESIGSRQKKFWRHPGSGLAEAVRWDFEKWQQGWDRECKVVQGTTRCANGK